jgi:lysophospholipase L1-like esterase
MLLLLACTEPTGLVASVSPDSGTATGYTELTVELSGFEGEPPLVSRAFLGGIEAYGLPGEPSASFPLTYQGSPESGAVSLELEIDGEIVEFPNVFTVSAPINPVFDRMVGIGASFTMGVQNGVPSSHGALASPGMLIAQRAGAFYSLPMLVPGLFPEIATTDIGPAPACEIPDIPDFVAGASADVIATLSDENGFTFAPGRETPELMPNNLSVGGMQVDVLANGTERFELNFLAHLVYDPFGALSAPTATTQLENAVAANPTLVVSFDLLGNNLIWSVVTERYLDPTAATPAEDLRAPLQQIFSSLAANGAEVFISNMPDPTVLGVARQKRALMVSDGAFTEEQAEAVAQEIRQLSYDYNAILEEESAAYATIHIVDVASMVQSVAEAGMLLGDQTVPISLVGGFISLDGLHFSNTGYGMLANVFIQAINAELGTELDEVDLAAIYADDPHNLDRLSEQGFEQSACEQ